MLRVASVILGSLGAKELAWAGAGELGENVEQARKTEFFRWFHLEETGRMGSVVHFKPSAEKFRSLVTVSLSLDSRQRLIGAELVLSRSFIDSGRDGLFARDIAKSFLRVVTSQEERQAIGGLIGEIEQPPGNLSTTLIVRGNAPGNCWPALRQGTGLSSVSKRTTSRVWQVAASVWKIAWWTECRRL